jgi:transcriptional regulator with XRE-family HTH domain
MGFKENLKGELGYIGMPVKELAHATGIPKQTIDKYLLSNNSMPTADKAVAIESPRVFRRLYNEREDGVYGNQEAVFAGSAGTSSTVVARSSGRVRIAMAGFEFNSVKDWLHDGISSAVG